MQKKIKYKENRGKQRKTEDIRGFELKNICISRGLLEDFYPLFSSFFLFFLLLKYMREEN